MPAGEFDLIIELVGGPNLRRDIESVAPRGRVVFVGVPAGDDLQFSVRDLMRKRATIVGTVLRHRDRTAKASAVAAFEHEVVPLLADGRVQPFIEATYPHTDVQAAFRHLSSSGKRGKILLQFDRARASANP